MRMSLIKLTSAAILMTAFTAGTAYAGNEKNCDHKKTAAAKTQAVITATPQVTVLSDVQSSAPINKASTQRSAKTSYSFDEALRLCQKKGVTDLQACVDYKTGAKSNKS